MVLAAEGVDVRLQGSALSSPESPSTDAGGLRACRLSGEEHLHDAAGEVDVDVDEGVDLAALSLSLICFLEITKPRE